MLVVGLDLEEGVAFTGGGHWLVDQGFEGDQRSQDHFEEGVVDAALPVVVVFLHDRGGLGTSAEHELFNAFEELIADDLVFLGKLADGLVHMLIRIRAEFGGTQRRFLSCLEIEVFEDDCLFNAPNNVLDHS